MKKKFSFWALMFVLLPFALCAGFLFALGKLLRLSYQQISVIFNLYLQGGLLAMSAILPLAAAMWSLIAAPSWGGAALALTLLVYASIYVTGFVWLLRHYHLPMEYAFNLCVDDLNRLAAKWHMSYHAVNLIIFVLWWCAIVATHTTLAYLLLPA